MMTSEMRELMVQLTPILLGETNAPPSPNESTTTTNMETRSGSALQVPTPVMDGKTHPPNSDAILCDDEYCIELVLSGFQICAITP